MFDIAYLYSPALFGEEYKSIGYAGQFLKTNTEESLRWLKKAAEDDEQTLAHELLARLYAEGKYLEKDENLAFKWFLKCHSSWLGSEIPFINWEVGRRYHIGLGVAKDIQKANDYFESRFDKSYSQELKRWVDALR